MQRLHEAGPETHPFPRLRWPDLVATAERGDRGDQSGNCHGTAQCQSHYGIARVVELWVGARMRIWKEEPEGQNRCRQGAQERQNASDTGERCALVVVLRQLRSKGEIWHGKQ